MNRVRLLNQVYVVHPWSEYLVNKIDFFFLSKILSVEPLKDTKKSTAWKNMIKTKISVFQ